LLKRLGRTELTRHCQTHDARGGKKINSPIKAKQREYTEEGAGIQRLSESMTGYRVKLGAFQTLLGNAINENGKVRGNVFQKRCATSKRGTKREGS